MSVGVKRHAPAALPQGKRPGTHCTGGWVGPRAGLDVTRMYRRLGGPQDRSGLHMHVQGKSYNSVYFNLFLFG